MMLIPKTVTDGALVHRCTGALEQKKASHS